MPAAQVANVINRATDKWLEERQEAPMDKMKTWATKQLNNASELARQLGAGPILDAANERVETFTAGKRLLDEGGDAAELGVLAKKVACDAVAVDSDIIDRIQQVIDLYEEASTRLQTSSAGLGQLGRLSQAYSERALMYTKVLATIEQPPEEPPMTPAEWDATKLLQLRLAKANLGLRQQVGGNLAEQVPMPVQRRSHSSKRLCLDDEPPQGALQDSARPRTPPPAEKRIQRLNELLQELFRLQDLKGDGVLEEGELIKLNEKIAMLHYGKDVDKREVREKFKKLFRERLDPDGRPVPFSTFSTYMQQVLNEVDKDSRAQIMILEQFIAEAESARESFNFQSFASASDAQFMPVKQGSGALGGRSLPTHAEEGPHSAATHSSSLVSPPTPATVSPSNATVAASQTPSMIDLPDSTTAHGAGQRSSGSFAPPPRDDSDLSSASSGLPPSEMPMMQAPSTLADKLSAQPSLTSSSTSRSEASITESIPLEHAAERGYFGAREGSRSSTSAPYAVGDKIEVWSKTHKVWCPGLVQSFDRKLVNVKYIVPDGSAMVKIIPLEDEQLRLAGTGAGQAPPRRDQTPPRTPVNGAVVSGRSPGAIVGDPALEPRFMSPSAGGGSQHQSNTWMSEDQPSQGQAAGHWRSNMFTTDAAGRGGYH